MARIAVGNNVAEKIIMIASISTTCRGPKRLTMAQINEASSQPVGISKERYITVETR